MLKIITVVSLLIILGISQQVLAKPDETKFRAYNKDKSIEVVLTLKYGQIDPNQTYIFLKIKPFNEEDLSLLSIGISSLVSKYELVRPPFVDEEKLKEGHLSCFMVLEGILKKEEQDIANKILKYLSKIYRERITIKDFISSEVFS